MYAVIGTLCGGGSATYQRLDSRPALMRTEHYFLRTNVDEVREVLLSLE